MFTVTLYRSTFALMLAIGHSHFVPLTALVFEILICTPPAFMLLYEKVLAPLCGCMIIYSVFTKKRSQWYIVHFLVNTEYWGVFQTKIFSVAVFNCVK